MPPSRKWCQPRPSQKFGSFMATPKIKSLPTACCASTILTKVWTSQSRWIFFVFVCWHSANANYLIIPDIIPNYYPDSPAEKLSVTEMLKKRMREEEMAKEKPKRRRRSSVFGEHKESRPFVCECASYELLPDAPQSVDQLFSISNTIPPCQGRLCCACCQLEVWACVLRSWKHRHTNESKTQSWKGRGMRHCKMQPEATLVDGPQELKEDFCWCSPIFAQ